MLAAIQWQDVAFGGILAVAAMFIGRVIYRNTSR